MSEQQKKSGPLARLVDATRLTVTLDAPMLEIIRERAVKGKVTQAEVVRRLLRKALR